MEDMNNIYDHIKNHIKEKGFPPSGTQIAESLKMDYEKEVKPAVEKLVKKGKIKVDEAKEKIIEILE